MSTRSRIAVLQSSGKIHSVYCHSDGYPSYNGKMLKAHYNTEEKANELVNLGDLSFVEKSPVPLPSAPVAHFYGEGEPPILTTHSFDNPQKGVTIAYHRDRQEEFNKTVFENIEEFKKATTNSNHCEEYYYFFQEGKWFVSKGSRGDFQELTDELINED